MRLGLELEDLHAIYEKIDDKVDNMRDELTELISRRDYLESALGALENAIAAVLAAAENALNNC